MACFLCNTNAATERDAVDELKDQLNLLQNTFPDAAYPSVVNRNGALVATSLNEEKLGIDLTAIISAMQSAAKHFALILGMTGCPHLKIEGDSQIFSLFSLYGDYILVYFTNKFGIDGQELEDWSERKELKAIIEEMNKILITNLDETSTSSK